MVGNFDKITLITNADFPYGKSGENFTRNIAKGLAANHIEVEVIKYRGKMFDYENDTEIKSSNYLFTKHPRNQILKTLQIILNSIYTPFFILYRKLIKRDKVFVIFALKYAYELLPFLVWSKILNIKIYQVVADFYSADMIVPVWWKKPKYFFYKVQRKYLDRYFNGIVVLSHLLLDQALENKVKRKRTLLIPHFIDFISSNESTNGNKNKIICYCGAVSIQNGVIDLIQAFRKLKNENRNISLRIVGEKTQEVDTFLDRNNIDQSEIIFTGFLDKKNVEKELNQSTVLVNPRRESDWAQAGFPTKIGEYFATGIPVVSTAIGDIAQYFTDKKEIILSTPDSPSDLALAISYALDNDQKAREIGAEGKLWGKNNLDYVSNTKKLLNFIKRT